ncbi:MAG: DeoR family transcriptional regulator [Desulfobacteraceae bacterium]|nr:MAG: DeoR family transcriptional regulator [Desulfobacteraceae bacterium]
MREVLESKSGRKIQVGGERVTQEGKRAKAAALRQERILELVQREGFVSTENLARNFVVTPQTIRRDIKELSDEGKVRRYHGGAGLPSSIENVSYTTRKTLALPGKIRIARMLAEHIPDEASLFLDIGTTSEEIAKALLGREKLRIITNNLNVAVILSENENFDVIVTGGAVRGRDRGLTGEATIDFIRQFKIDYGIISVSGIDGDGTLLDFDYHEIRVGQAVIENSRKVFLVADHSKFHREAMVRLCNIREMDALFTDENPSEKIRQMLSAADVQLHVAAESTPLKTQSSRTKRHQ